MHYIYLPNSIYTVVIGTSWTSCVNALMIYVEMENV